MVQQTSSNLYSQSFGTTSSSSVNSAVIQSRPPASTDVKGPTGFYPIGQRWVDQSTPGTYTLTLLSTSNGVTSATWTTDGGGASGLTTLSGNSGTATPTAGNIQIAGDNGIITAASASVVDVSMNSPFTGDFEFTKDVASTDLTLLVDNQSGTSGANSAIIAQVLPFGGVASMGVSTVGLRSLYINASNESTRVRVTINGILGVGTVVQDYYTLGSVTLPLQSSFFTYLPSSATNATGAGGVYQLSSLTEVWDNQDSFDASAGIFTAAVPGKYTFKAGFLVTNLDATFTSCQGNFSATGSATQSVPFGEINIGAVRTSGNGCRVQGSCDMQLSAGDTVVCTLTVTGGGGNTLTVNGTAPPIYTTYFSGYLAN